MIQDTQNISRIPQSEAINLNELKSFLDEKVILYNNPKFIESDPIQIPHSFSNKNDIEISAFLLSSFAWGNRKIIINKGKELMSIFGNAPYDFVVNHQPKDLEKLRSFKHRTFNHEDIVFFVTALKNIYNQYGSLEDTFLILEEEADTAYAIDRFRSLFLQTEHLTRSEKHISSPVKGSAAKRLNMFLRWMVRNDNQGVDFGLWNRIPASKLVCPLDVHSGNVARKLGLLTRTQNDWKAASELNDSLKKLDPDDPVKYDFALFGLGVFEGF